MPLTPPKTKTPLLPQPTAAAPPLVKTLRALAAAVCAAFLLAEARAQTPPELLPPPLQAPGEYNPAHPQFSDPRLCQTLGGTIQSPSVCAQLDRAGTFCIVASRDAFPCRGLFKHVIRCNDLHNRPALNPFLCAEKCQDENANLRARGQRCERALLPPEVIAPAARAVRYDPAENNIVLARAENQYTLAFQQNLQLNSGRELQKITLAHAENIPAAAPGETTVTRDIVAKITCAGCYPNAVTLLAEFSFAESENITIVQTTAMVTTIVEKIVERETQVTLVETSLVTVETETQVTVAETSLVTINTETFVTLAEGALVTITPPPVLTTLEVETMVTTMVTLETQVTIIPAQVTVIPDPVLTTIKVDRVVENRVEVFVTVQGSPHVILVERESTGTAYGFRRSGEAEFVNMIAAALQNEAEAVSLMLDEGADIEFNDIGGTYEGLSPLMAAASAGGYETAKLLVDLGANVNAPGTYGPLLFSVLSVSAPRIVSLLLENGANISRAYGLSSGRDRNKTALHFASETGFRRGGPALESMRILLENGANVSLAAGNQNRTPLHFVAGGSHSNPTVTMAAQLLLDWGADIEAVANFNYRPLHEAAQTGNAAMIRFLLANHAEVNAPSGEGTPLHIADSLGYGTNVTQPLIDAGGTR